VPSLGFGQFQGVRGRAAAAAGPLPPEATLAPQARCHRRPLATRWAYAHAAAARWLKYGVAVTLYVLDETVPEWEQSPYFTLTLSGTLPVRLLRAHLYAPCPVADYAAALVIRSKAEVSISKRRSCSGFSTICARSSETMSRQEGRVERLAHFGGGR
jgi:hypothetical protein